MPADGNTLVVEHQGRGWRIQTPHQSLEWMTCPLCLHAKSGQVAMAGAPRYGRAITYPEVHHVHFADLAL